ncbi:alpha/beta family hydrolase [Ramlibacter sp.]|uniref:alpha/beta hydrolase family protein n=1 Tax=Ramlibacter sp. TaxID=1917967 RepID=UPI002621AAA3|nr:alpha/beta family hydrolase [Ramlibacter sp.]MDB5954295.1 alpha/beta hydrolase [Ramlibacter sp.]
MSPAAEPLRLALPEGATTSALLDLPDPPHAALVLAHGAGAGMQHMFLASLAQGLAERHIATLRFQFPFAEHGVKRPDSPARAQATVRCAVAEAARRLPGVPLFAGGKSFGGRMSSQAQAEEPLAGVRGLVFVGFPLHPASKPATARAAHLQQVQLPMLFLQGTRDALADLGLIRQVHASLGARATLHVVEGADHAFHVLARSGRTDAQVLQELLDATARWMASVTPGG